MCCTIGRNCLINIMYRVNNINVWLIFNHTAEWPGPKATLRNFPFGIFLPLCSTVQRHGEKPWSLSFFKNFLLIHWSCKLQTVNSTPSGPSVRWRLYCCTWPSTLKYAHSILHYSATRSPALVVCLHHVSFCWLLTSCAMMMQGFH